VQRLLVNRRIAGEFIPRFVAATRALKFGDPAEPSTIIGPMITVAHAQRAKAWIDEAASGGAEILTGGRRDGALLEPTVLYRVTDSMRVFCEEIFAPVVSVIEFDRLDEAVARANAINPLVYKTLPYDTDKDFAPISLIARAPMVAVANENFPPNNITELVTYAKQHPNAVNFASVGAGSASHLTAELFDMTANVSMTHVPYKGGAPAQTDLMGGQVQVMWGTAPYAQSLVKAGKLKALGQASATRSPAFPALPTVAEQGLPNFEAYGWIGLLAPAGTPSAVVAFWNQQLAKAVKNPEIAKRLADQGFEVVVSSPEKFGAFIQSEQKTWAKVIKEKNISLQ